MLIGLAGPDCAGRSTVANYLIEHHRYRRVSIGHGPPQDLNVMGQQLVDSHQLKRECMRKQEYGYTTRPKSYFKTAEELCEYATLHWRDDMVTTDVLNITDYQTLSKRPFFLLVGVDAPLGTRLARYNNYAFCAVDARYADKDDFINWHESFYSSGGAEVLNCASVRILNTFKSVKLFEEHIKSLDLANPDRLRPSWDTYFMRLASLAAMRSNCMKRRVGCVLVRGKRVIATGYNGTPRGITNCNEGGCDRCNKATIGGQGLGTCLCLHAEENALLESGRERVGVDATLYCNTCPCLTCSVKIAQVGVKEVVFHQSYSMDEQSALILKEAGVILRQFSPPDQTF
ncbi:putative deoxycytidylate deaminase [Protomyces lactucae-debilis]|uniref:Deoxycytidylate deaminase n=1 Tax=Protomyces lactucae-debilis TaxID=2754530 RepID=A0A1Y2FLN5_PROLT|nr:putative deoxycytidylate deaminase [Protomyces lactucae-debilis]ORY84274.1 putative deoxycytidylate deaminase [Protomyces lactucae-debilis]